ncbi:MAG TPA: PLP-dependent aminotransferase family protein [Candidatus Dormibacteraeota bacterium]|jgi:GntR family transcriptional regulator/MocR family aminotransferase|nr:PLP-dependent aminotransferase family protein [Candidatus Dormibacteraeota bacterium]
MSKRSTSFQLALPPQSGSVPAYRWLYSAIRQQILDGGLRPGSHLPSTRELARLYRLSRGTIVAAFDQLRSEGYLEGTIGSGTRVSKTLPEDWLNVRHREIPRENKNVRRQSHLSRYGKNVTLFGGYGNRPTRAFRSNVPALDEFPMELWTQISSRVLRRASTQHLLGCDSMGYKPLQQAIVEYLAASRGVKCQPDQIAVVSGIQEALDLTARLFLDRGDRVCMEAPGYVGAARVFEAAGAKLIHLELDSEGMKLPQRNTRFVRLVYVTPGHQFPLGTTMSLSRRLELLDWANFSGAMIFEDDYDGEFRYSGHPIPALQGLDRSSCVLYAGSFSKVLFPSLRLAYLVVPEALVDRFTAAKSITTRHAPLLDQAVLCEFIENGHFARHIRRMRELYAARLAALLQSAREELSGLLEVSPIEAGLQTVGWLQNGIQEKAAARAAKAYNVDVTPLGIYRSKPLARPALQLGFAGVNPREIRRGVRDLARALSSLT